MMAHPGPRSIVDLASSSGKTDKSMLRLYELSWNFFCRRLGRVEAFCEISGGDFSWKSKGENLREFSQNSRPKASLTARDVTGFYAFFSAWRSSKFLHLLGVISLLKFTLHRKPAEKRKNQLEKTRKIQWRRLPEIVDFCPLSWSNTPGKVMLHFSPPNGPIEVNHCLATKITPQWTCGKNSLRLVPPNSCSPSSILP